jgi:hypothetical protein
MPSYGIDAMFDDLDDGRAHGRDERIGVKAFDQDVEFTYRLMKAHHESFRECAKDDGDKVNHAARSRVYLRRRGHCSIRHGAPLRIR